MTEEHQHRTVAAVRRPEIVDLVVAQMLDLEPCSLQTFGKQRLTARVVGRERGAANQINSEVKNLRHEMGSQNRKASLPSFPRKRESSHSVFRARQAVARKRYHSHHQ